jgi:enoyl-[acyl-carrier protein] reductase/trans-2-enoyl-CoA reductase (NAD+)
MVGYAKSCPGAAEGPRRALVIGASGGYGLSSRIAAAFCYGASTIGVSLERPGAGQKTGTAGFYNNRAFEKLAAEAGLIAHSVNGDAFSESVKAETVALIKNKLPGGKVDLVVYSIAAPRRTHPVTGEVFSSVIKPVGAPFTGSTIQVLSGEMSEVTIEPATEGEIAGTVAVMGGEDWLLWMEALGEAGVLAHGVTSVAYSYIGPELTHAIYRGGTMGRAKDDLDQKAAQIASIVAPIGGRAFVSVNKALVTQASSAIPVVPLYISLLYRIMKRNGTHEGCTEQMVRMLQRIYPEREGELTPAIDQAGRLRMDDWEMNPKVQREISELWGKISPETLPELADAEGYRKDFFRLFGFEVPGVDYGADVPEPLI